MFDVKVKRISIIKLGWILGFIFLLFLPLLISCQTAKEKAEPTPKPLLKYSFPPNVAEVEKGKYTEEEIDQMAQELELEKIYDGKYYKNKAGCVFVPEQVPTIYEHKSEYFEELNSYWLK